MKQSYGMGRMIADIVIGLLLFVIIGLLFLGG